MNKIRKMSLNPLWIATPLQIKLGREEWSGLEEDLKFSNIAPSDYPRSTLSWSSTGMTLYEVKEREKV